VSQLHVGRALPYSEGVVKKHAQRGSAAIREERSARGADGAEASPSAPGRTVLVSNRLPVTITRQDGEIEIVPSAGGLATAMGPMHAEGDGVWVGWPGEMPSEPAVRRKMLQLLRERRLQPVKLPAEVVDGFYAGFSNSILWPLLHYGAHLAVLERGWWRAYQRANRIFAAKVAEVARPGDVIWVHDYHLMLLPEMLRQRLRDVRIVYFLHTPFPSSEIFRILPWRRELVQGLLGAELIGFHTFDYLRHFRATVQRVLGSESERDQVSIDGRSVRLGVFPIGIEADRFWRTATRDPKALEELEALKAQVPARKLILGVDRMDYTKGIPERLEGYERFLERFESYRGKVEFLQIGVPSRADLHQYERLRRTVEGIVGRINGRFGAADWTPVKYLYRGVPFQHLCALYRHARVALITPLRDGMNLVAKEYVACQRGAGGVLVLSEFAGAAADLTEAVLVNPYDVDSIADGLHSALTMPARERRRREQSLARRVWRGDVGRWGARVLRALASREAEETPYPPRLEGELRATLIESWLAASGRALLLDYDGTLRGFVSRPENARPDRKLLALLRRLAALPGVEVAVISGRDRETLGRWLGGLPITLVAEHGRWTRETGGDWVDVLGGRRPEWLDEVRELLEEVSAVTPGAFVEEKSAALAWHYRTTNLELAELRLREIDERLQQLRSETDFDVLAGNRVLEIRVAGVSKGTSLVSLLAGKPPIDLIVAVGDDQTDEEMFAQLPRSAWTVHVGSRRSVARFSLADPSAVSRLLQELATMTEAQE